MAESEAWTLELGIKSSRESEVAGERGLVIQGYASRYHEVDQSGERQLPGAFKAIDEEWGAEREPLILWQHGLDPDLGTRRLGRGLSHRLDEAGLWIEAFIPQTPRFKDAAALGRFRTVYDGIKSGAVRGLSVGGSYLRTATGAIKRWSLAEVSVTDRPCLASATFTVGHKAITEAYGQVPPILDDEPADAGKGETTPMAAEQTAATITAPAGHVIVSAPYNAGSGGWTVQYASGGTLEAGAKAVTKSEPDGDHPSSHYLYVGDPEKPTTWKLRYKDADGNLSPRLLGACHAALTVGYRGNKVDLPESAKQECMAKLKKLYKQAGLDWPEDSSSSGGKGRQAVLLAGADVLRDYVRAAKAGAVFSAQNRAKIRAACDGIQAHVDDLRAHVGLADEEQDEDESAPLVR